ncbi:hypothetical protein B0H13DRAFT_1854015 [Mycena leptocephala]|nr:hypothetical protein B0H13DRAFT_1854015 [Mycena leptocephala]
MRFTALIPLVLSAVGLVHAIDRRLLYAIPAGDTMDSFTSDFDEACATWPPAIDAGLTFAEAFLQPGDFGGNHSDTEAKIFCLWTDGTTFTEFTTAVADSLGATHV